MCPHTTIYIYIYIYAARWYEPRDALALLGACRHAACLQLAAATAAAARGSSGRGQQQQAPARNKSHNSTPRTAAAKRQLRQEAQGFRRDALYIY
jgi:hypothetical protein